MTNLQTAPLALAPFDALAFGTGCDHMIQLARAPDWLSHDVLRAAIVVTVRTLKLPVDADVPDIPVEPPFRNGEPVAVRYRGLGQAKTVIAGPRWLCCGDVCNSPEASPCSGASHITEMPKRYRT